jgi:hypothetical protein
VTVEKDLALEVTRASKDAIDHERDPGLEVWLVNRSPSATYPVVLSNDGSESGWREPHAFYTIDRQVSGRWEPVKVSFEGRCGLYAEDWTKDVVSLGPGQRVKMPSMPYVSDELGEASAVRVVAHYEYGDHARDKSKVPPILHAMPSYVLASAPLVVAVAHPYRLAFTLKGPLPKTPGASLYGVIDVVAENQGSKPLPFANTSSGAQLFLEAKTADGEEHTFLLDAAGTHAATETTRPGERRSIVTSDAKTDVIWELPTAKIRQLRAIWRVWDREPTATQDNVRRVESAWVDMP